MLPAEAEQHVGDRCLREVLKLEMMISEGSRLWHTAASMKGKAVGLLGRLSFLSVCGSVYFLAAKCLGHQAKGLTVPLRPMSSPKKKPS